MRKSKLLWLAVLLLAAHPLWAQPREITGKITDEKGTPIAGVTVQEKNTRNGTSTDASGVFGRSEKPRATIVISSVGFDKKEVALTGDMQVVNVSLNTATTSISEVVVTAMGVRRGKKALGYAVTTIDKAKVEIG